MRTHLRAFVVRAALAAIVLLAIFVASFLVMRLAPGGPFDRLDGIEPEVAANLAARYGLDGSLPEQLVTTLTGFVQGDFGPSLTFAPGRQVAEVLSQTLPVSLELGFYALLVAFLLGGGLGIAAGRRPGSRLDRAIGGLSLLVISASVIVIASLARSLLIRPDGVLVLGGFDSWRNKLLPSLVLGVAYAAILARLVRANVATVVAQGTGRGALARGVSPARVFARYVLPGALIPMLSYLGSMVAALLTGSFVVESIFEVPGVAACFVAGAQGRDYPLVMAAIMVYSAMLLSLNLLFESLHTALDPRLRRRGTGGTR